MDYILSGDPNEVAKVLQENRLRVDRKVIKFTPYQPETANQESDDKYINAEDSKTVTAIDSKTSKRAKKGE